MAGIRGTVPAGPRKRTEHAPIGVERDLAGPRARRAGHPRCGVGSTPSRSAPRPGAHRRERKARVDLARRTRGSAASVGGCRRRRRDAFMKPEEAAAAARGTRLQRTPAARGTCVRPPPAAERARPIDRSRHGRSMGRSNVKAYPMTNGPRPSAAASAASRARARATRARPGSPARRVAARVGLREEDVEARPTAAPSARTRSRRSATRSRGHGQRPASREAPLVDLDQRHAPRGRAEAATRRAGGRTRAEVGPRQDRRAEQVEKADHASERHARREKSKRRRSPPRRGAQDHEPYRTPARTIDREPAVAVP